jgi:hypothetical protein
VGLAPTGKRRLFTAHATCRLIQCNKISSSLDDLAITSRRSAACCASTAARPPTPTRPRALRRVGASLTEDAARSTVERAVCAKEGALW